MVEKNPESSIYFLRLKTIMGDKFFFQKISIIFLLLVVFAFPGLANATLYQPGATLEPDCGPTESNCGVATTTVSFTLNNQDGASQTLIIGSTGTDFNIDSASNIHTFNIPTSSATVRGLLSGTDWSTFNNKLGTDLLSGKVWIGNGSGTATARTISGAIALSSTGVASIVDGAVTTNTIASGNVSFDKIQELSATKIIGNPTDSTASASEISIGNGLTFSGTDLIVNSPTCASNQRLSWSGTAFECKSGGVFGEIVNANQFLMGPTTGDPTNPTFRSIIAADLGSGTANNQAVLLGNLSWFDLLDGSGKIESALLPSSVTGSLQFKGTWDANTNTPTLSSSGTGGTDGEFYIVDVASTTNTIDGHSIWNVGDWIVHNGTTWDRVEQGATVSSVNSQTGAIVLDTDDISEGLTNLYFTNTRARQSISGTGAISYSSTTGVIDCPTCIITGSTNGDIVAGTGLSISGTLSNRLVDANGNDVTFALSNTAVSADTYGSNTSVPYFTVDAQGRLTNAGTTTLDTDVLTSGTLSVARGGTGATTFTTNGILYGNGTSAISATSAGTSGQFLVANASGIPTFVSASGDATIGATGAITVGNSAITSAKIANDTIADADISSTAAISYSKLSLTNSIVAGDIVNGTISNNKLANSTVGLSLVNSGSDVSLSASSVALGDNLIVYVPNAGATARGVVSTTTQTFAGNKTFANTLTVTGTTTIAGDFITSRGPDYTVTGQSDDVNLGSGSYFHYAGNGNATFTGIAGGVDGKRILIMNDTEDYNLTITNADTSSLAQNRIETPTGEAIIVPPELSVGLQYESGSNVWHIITLPATEGAVNDYAFVRNGNAFGITAILGTTDAYGLNLMTGGTTRLSLASNASTLTGTGATTLTTDATSALNLTTGTTGVLTIDSGTTGAINIGTGANAKAITIGNATGATGVTINSGSGNINLNGNVALSDGYTFTTGTGITTLNSTALTLAGNNSIIDMTGTGTLGLNSTTNRAITTGTGMFSTGGDLTILGDDLFMGTNTSGALLVADGTNFNPVVMSGDASISAAGALTINYAGAQAASAINKGFLTAADWSTFNSKQAALGFTPENVANKSTDTTFSENSDTLYPSQKAVKAYVDGQVGGLSWQPAVELINVIGTSTSPVLTPTNLDAYIIDAGGNSGDWSGFDEGDLVQYQTDTWVKIKSLAVGDRFGIAFKSSTSPTGSMAGKKNYKVQVTGGTSGAFTYTFTAPVNNDALFVQNANAYYHNVSFVYSSTLGEWIQMSATVDWTMGSGLQANGRTASLGNLTSNWNQTGLYNIITAGGITVGGALNVTGTTTLSGNRISSSTNYTTTGTQTAADLGATSLVYYKGSNTLTLAGIINGVDGKFIRFINSSSYNITLKHQDSSAADADRIIIETGADATIPPNSTFELSYDNTVSRWRVAVLPTTATDLTTSTFIPGGNAFGATATLGTTDGYGLSIITNNTNRFSVSSSSATFTGVGATEITTDATSALRIIASTTGALTLDSGTTGAINLGTGLNGKAITIGNVVDGTALSLKSGTGGISFDGATTFSSSTLTLSGNNTVLDMSGTGTLSLNTTTNRPITTGTGLVTLGGGLYTTGTSTFLSDFITPIGTDYTTTGTNNNTYLGTGSVFRYNGVGTATFTGFAGGSDGKQIRLINKSSSAFTLNHEDSNSSAENRILISSAQPITISQNGSVTLLYDASISRWRLVQIPASSAIVGTFAFINNGNSFGTEAKIGTSDANILSFITGGATRLSLSSSAATLTGTGATTITTDATSALNLTTGTTGILTVDSGTTGAVNLGTGANAKTVTIGNATGATAVNMNSGTGGITLLTGTTGAVSIKSGTTGAVTLDSGTTGAVNIGNGNNAKTISIGTGTAGNTINIGNDDTTADILNIGSAKDALTLNSTGLNVSSAGALTGVASIDTIAMNAQAMTFAGNGIIYSTGANAINIDSGTTGAVNIGTSTNAKTITIGNATGATDVVINSGTGGITLLTGTTGAVSIKSGTTGAVTLDSGTTGAVNIGNGANAKTITIGNTTGASAVSIQSGTGAITLEASGTGTSGKVQIGTVTGKATPDVLVLDAGTSDPTGTDGAMYYSTATNKFRCFQNGAWTNCIGGDKLFITKSADQSVTNSATLVSDSALQFPIAAGESWVVQWNLLVSNSNNAGPDWKSAVLGPTGATCLMNLTGEEPAGAAFPQAKTTDCTTPGTLVNNTIVADGATNIEFNVRVQGIITAGGTGGTVALQFAENTAAAATTITVKQGSYMTAFKVGGADLAEAYNSNDLTVEPGDVVSIDELSANSVKKSSKNYDSNAMGIASTKPGLILADASDLGQGTTVFVALSGRVPVKVSTMNGAIAIGDYLTTSSIPGVAMKATENGPVIGQALSAYNGTGEGKVIAFVKNTYNSGYSITEQQLLLGDISPKINADGTDNGLSTLISTIQTESPRDPISIIGKKISDGKQFLTDFVVARITAIRGYFNEIFTKKIHTEEICVKKSDGNEVCVNGDQVDSLLKNANISQNQSATVSNSITEQTQETATSTSSNTQSTGSESTSSTTPAENPIPAVETPAENIVVENPVASTPVEEVVPTPEPEIVEPVTPEPVVTEPASEPVVAPVVEETPIVPNEN